MVLKNVKGFNPQTVMGIDCSTNGAGICVLDKGVPVKWGKINFKGPDIYARIKDAGARIDAVKDDFQVDFILLESAVVGPNAATGLKLSLMYGAVLSHLLIQDTKIDMCAPNVWMNYIGNKTMTKAQTEQLTKANPGKSKSWVTEEKRRVRKTFTLNWVKDKYGIELEDDDVGDSFGLAYYAYSNMDKYKNAR